MIKRIWVVKLEAADKVGALLVAILFEQSVKQEALVLLHEKRSVLALVLYKIRILGKQCAKQIELEKYLHFFGNSSYWALNVI